MRYLRLFVLLLAAGAQWLWAGSGITSGFEFLRTDYSPRSAAMAGSYGTMRGDVNGLFVNPAGMAFLQTQQFGFNYSNYIQDINGGTALYSRLVPQWGVVSVGIIYMDYGTFREMDAFAAPTGNEFTANDFALAVGLANHLSAEFTYGVNLKYAFSKIEQYSASALALDFGLMYDAPFLEDFNLAVTLNNLGANFEYYSGVKESLPLRLNVSGSKILEHLPLEISFSLNDLNMDSETFWDRFLRFSVGGEFRVSKLLRLRLGYNHALHTDLSDDSFTASDGKYGGLSAGLGIRWKTLELNYAYANYSILGNIHRFGISGSLPEL